MFGTTFEWSFFGIGFGLACFDTGSIWMLLSYDLSKCTSLSFDSSKPDTEEAEKDD
jgi:hypothetical protein